MKDERNNYVLQYVFAMNVPICNWDFKSKLNDFQLSKFNTYQGATTLSIMSLFVILSIMTSYQKWHSDNSTLFYAECRDYLNGMLSVITLSVITLNVTMLSVVRLNVVAP